MRQVKGIIKLFAIAAIVVLAVTGTSYGQETGFISREAIKAAMAERDAPPTEARHAAPKGFVHDPNVVQRCKGPVKKVVDTAFEGVKITSFNWSNTTGGGETGRFDKKPVLSTTVNLTEDCSCLDAHFSAMVGSKQSYGFLGIASITFFQVTLTPTSGVGNPVHMVGHFETPYGQYGPVVAIEAERDVDMISANFFQRVGDMPGDVAPGQYRVDVWWSGGPVGGGGAIGADFVLKLYQR